MIPIRQQISLHLSGVEILFTYYVYRKRTLVLTVDGLELKDWGNPQKLNPFIPKA